MHAPPRTTSTLAIVSLVFGLLGWSLLPMIGSTVAVITGHMARGEIRRSVEPQGGDGLAVAGLVLGYSAIILGILSIVAIFVFLGGFVWLANLH